MHAYARLVEIQTATRLVYILKEIENKRNLLAREVAGALISSYRAHGRLEVPEIKWARTNNYKFYTFRSVHFDPCTGGGSVLVE